MLVSMAFTFDFSYNSFPLTSYIFTLLINEESDLITIFSFLLKSTIPLLFTVDAVILNVFWYFKENRAFVDPAAAVNV